MRLVGGSKERKRDGVKLVGGSQGPNDENNAVTCSALLARRYRNN
jgi:hypothetical protein